MPPGNNLIPPTVFPLQPPSSDLGIDALLEEVGLRLVFVVTLGVGAGSAMTEDLGKVLQHPVWPILRNDLPPRFRCPMGGVGDGLEVNGYVIPGFEDMKPPDGGNGNGCGVQCEETAFHTGTIITSRL
jgi:hypothetical protein